MASTQASPYGESGMTLVELLVVMLIIGALAALAIPSFFSQSAKGRDAAAKVQARTAATAMEIYASDNDGSYAGATPVILHDVEPTINSTSLVVAGFDGTGPAAAKAYRVTAISATGERFWLARDANGMVRLGCQAVSTGGCPSDGRWG
jgi:prepilin-type N-terminal cleavage/methylation domain-containing protein